MGSQKLPTPEWVQEILDRLRAMPVESQLRQALGASAESYRRVKAQRDSLVASLRTKHREIADLEAKVTELETVIIKRLTSAK